MRLFNVMVAFLLLCINLFGQKKPFATLPEHLRDTAFAEWISPTDNNETGVFYFRKKVDINSVPEKFIIHVSADNRYRLYVNETLVSWGPAVGDILNWNYETVDIAPYLKKGKNIIASQVWNLGNLKGARQISNKTAFILQGNSTLENQINTNSSWLFAKDSGYFFNNMTTETVGGGYLAGATDSLIGKWHPWNWQKLSYNDSKWHQSKELGKGNHTGLDTWQGTPWHLKQREIPPMEQVKQTIPKILYVNGLSYNTSAYHGLSNLNIPPHTQVDILFDNQTLTMGYPQLVVENGKDSKIKIQYQESLFDENGQKGNRDEWQGKIMKGYYDVFIPSGGLQQFQPLWVRTFRYVKLTVETKEDPLNLLEFYNLFTAYPLQEKAHFSANNSTLSQIWETSWRTTRLCALETFMDCPYYEQLQYIGDTRVQALISMYAAGDEALVKNAINQFYASLQPFGLTKSNHPSNNQQIIPPFSLLFINMLHDYHMYRDNSSFVKQYIPGIKFILDWFVSKIADNGMLGPIPYWNHIDGGTLFENGSPPGAGVGGSAHLSILLAYTLDKAVELLKFHGFSCDAAYFEGFSASLKKNTLKLCYDEGKKLIAETPEKTMFSQHTNSFAILAGMFEEKQAKVVAQKIISDDSLVQATLYFNFYVFQALKKVGLGEEVITAMDKWLPFLENGFSTFPEHGINSRSDCHAWAAHPIFDFLSIVCGVEPSSPGFKSVEIRPQIGNLSNVKAKIPHPLGEIDVNIQQEKDGASLIKIELPDGLAGKLIYKQLTYPLSGGYNEFNLK